MAELLLRIRLFDGVKAGCRQCSVKTKSLVGYLIPFGKLDVMSSEKDLSRNGVYFLFGEDRNSEQTLYVGKVEARNGESGLKSRLAEHVRNQSIDWTVAIVLTAINDGIGASEASYLENRFHELAKMANKCIVLNQRRPPKGVIQDCDEAELEGFVQDGIVYLAALGKDVLSIPPAENKSESEIVFTGKTARCDAKLVIRGESFVLLKGSRISSKEAKTCPISAKRSRRSQKDLIDGSGVLKQDIPFSTPSAAACFATGSTQSGRTFFKDQNGNNLGDVQS